MGSAGEPKNEWVEYVVSAQFFSMRTDLKDVRKIDTAATHRQKCARKFAEGNCKRKKPTSDLGIFDTAIN